MSPRKLLIVTADDFGLHPSVNEAVERASQAGILTAASLMVSAPAADDAVRRAHALPSLRVGLHLVLTDGESTLDPRQIPDLADPRGRFDDAMFVNGVRFFALPSVRRQLRAEIRAQFLAFQRTGLALDHVNAHKHFHLHPTLLTMVLEVGAEFGVTAIRVPGEPWWFSARHDTSPGGRAAAAMLMPWVYLMRRRLRARGIACNDRIFGIARSGAMDEPVMIDILARLPAGVTEIYLHPATQSGIAIAPSMPEYRHAEEFSALLSTQVRRAVDASGAVLGAFRDIAG